jgi:hypothetical protein
MDKGTSCILIINLHKIYIKMTIFIGTGQLWIFHRQFPQTKADFCLKKSRWSGESISPDGCSYSNSALRENCDNKQLFQQNTPLLWFEIITAEPNSLVVTLKAFSSKLVSCLHLRSRNPDTGCSPADISGTREGQNAVLPCIHSCWSFVSWIFRQSSCCRTCLLMGTTRAGPKRRIVALGSLRTKPRIVRTQNSETRPLNER